jgi:hypothetical protein
MPSRKCSNDEPSPKHRGLFQHYRSKTDARLSKPDVWIAPKSRHRSLLEMKLQLRTWGVSLHYCALCQPLHLLAGSDRRMLPSQPSAVAASQIGRRDDRQPLPCRQWRELKPFRRHHEGSWCARSPNRGRSNGSHGARSGLRSGCERGWRTAQADLS